MKCSIKCLMEYSLSDEHLIENEAAGFYPLNKSGGGLGRDSGVTSGDFSESRRLSQAGSVLVIFSPSLNLAVFIPRLHFSSYMPLPPKIFYFPITFRVLLIFLFFLFLVNFFLFPSFFAFFLSQNTKRIGQHVLSPPHWFG